MIAGTSAGFAQQQGAPGGAPSGQMAPKSAGGGETTGQPTTPGAVHNGAAESKGGKNAAEERGEQTKPNRTGEAPPNRNLETTGQAPQNERQQNTELRRGAAAIERGGRIGSERNSPVIPTSRKKSGHAGRLEVR
jgi:hypothetical protein